MAVDANSVVDDSKVVVVDFVVDVVVSGTVVGDKVVVSDSENRARDAVVTVGSKVIAFVVISTVGSIFIPIVVSAVVSKVVSIIVFGVVSKVVFKVVSYVGSRVSKMVPGDGSMVVGMMVIVSSEAVSVVKDIIVG